MYVLSQYALGNDPTPDAKMQTLNLALPDARGVLHSVTPSVAVGTGAGAASSGVKTQKSAKDGTKAAVIKAGERFPESGFLLGGAGTPCTGPCNDSLNAVRIPTTW